MMRIRFSTRLATTAVALLLAAGAGRAQAQDAVISGTVSGEQGRPIAGATVFVPQLSLGTNTNANGKYTLTVPASRATGQSVVVTVRFIGYAPQRKTITLSAGTQAADFTLVRDVIQLNEVVVTGVSDATETKKLAFSVGVVNAEQLHDVPASSPAGALQGKVAGAQVSQSSGDPGKAPSIKLRSATSLTGSQEPLIIVDGTITRLSLADINSEDIERMEVIKGAAASSLYGSDAANGVIQIFTKRGANLPEDKTSFTFRNEMGTNALPKTLPQSGATIYRCCDTTVVNGQQVIDFQRDADGARIADPANIAKYSYPVYYDHQGEALRNGNFYTNYLSMGQRRGGTNYNASFQNLRQEGILFGVKGYNRQNFRLNVDQTVNDRLDLSLGGFYGRSNNNNTAEGAGSPFFSLLFLEPHINLYGTNDDGTPYRADPQDIATSSNATNPLYYLANVDQTTSRNRYTGTFQGKYRIADWLVAQGNYNFDGDGEQYTVLTPKGFLSKTGQAQTGSLQRQTVNGRTVNTGLQLTTTKTFTPWLTNTSKVKVEYEGQSRDTFALTGGTFSVARTPEFGAISGALQPYSTNTTVRNRDEYFTTDFDIRDRYEIGGVIRQDESSLFGSQERSHTYYRLSGAYRLTEDFKMPGVDEFKLRASRGTAGLRPPFEAQYETFSLLQGGGLKKNTLGNPLLKPAQSAETEVGFNIDFLSRFTFEYTYSQKTTSDQILLVPLSAATGYQYQWQNAGSLEGRTHEAALRASLVDRQNFTWRLNVSGDRTRQKVTKLNVAPFLVGPGYGLGSSEDNNRVTRVFRIAEGETFGTIYGARLLRNIDDLYDDPSKASASGAGQAWSRDSVMINEDGFVVRKSAYGTKAERALQYVDKNGNGIVKIGDVNPDFNLSFNSNITFGSFAVSGLVNWVHGGNIYNGTRQWPFFEYRDRVYDQRGKPVSAQKPRDYYSNSFYNSINPIDYFVEDGSYIKLKELAVNYTVPRALMSRVHIGGVETARIGIVGRNLWTHTKYSGYDPEVAGLAGDPYSFRFDGFSYPNFRTFTGMVELGF